MGKSCAAILEPAYFPLFFKVAEETYVVKVDFNLMWETANKANQIFNTTGKDDPVDANQQPDADGNTYGVPRNNLYLVPDPASSKYRATVKADIQPDSVRQKIIAAVIAGSGKVPGSDKPFDASGECALEFTHTGSDIQNFTVRVGFDANNNGLLDETEIMPFVIKNIASGQTVGDPIIRGSSLAFYSSSRIWLEGGQLSGLLYPNGADFLKVFCDGNADNVGADNVPLVDFESFNCFSGAYHEWLTHNSGATFNDAGTVQDLPHYTWTSTRRISQAIADSDMIKQAAVNYYYNTLYETQVLPFFASNPTVNEKHFDVAIPHQSVSPASWPPATVDFHTTGIYPDDLGVTVGRGRVVQHRADFLVQRDTGGNPILRVTTWQTYGAVEDLYDFNHDQSNGLALPQKAAAVQIGHGKGNYGTGRAAGVIYRVTVNFSKFYGGF